MTHEDFLEEPWEAVEWLTRIDAIFRRKENGGNG